MFCGKCGKELREGVKFCTACGKAVENTTIEQCGQTSAESNGAGKLIVYGYTQWFVVKPKVDILKNGIKVAQVSHSDKAEIDIKQDCTIKFKCSLRTAVIHARAGVTQEIQLSFDRITGALLAVPVNSVENREKEQREFELAKIQAEKEARILQMKKENATKAGYEEGNKKSVDNRPKKIDKYVFISYSTKDNVIAEKTKVILENSGINCWIAPWSITAGGDYASEIPKALSECSAMVLLLSKSSQESKWVPKEIGTAIENGKIIIPFQIDNETISDSFNFYLTNSQRISAFNRMNDAYEELTQSLYRLLQID